ncbi:MAG TPA: 3-phosphoshikimate 1-carboxyvinyltransferase [Bacteroidales bacterium]|nr:3-phosphoshikimate 1-carboxyvinyltransferase [Bacteroidales bacterium]
MERSFDPSEVQGIVRAPASKSMTQRAIAAALLANGESIIINPSYCDDGLAALSVAAGLGARVEPQPGEIRITGSSELKETKLNCGESGLAIRMFSPVAALYPIDITLSGAATLRKRPMSMIADALSQLGASCKTTEGYLPLTVKGPLKGGECEIDGSISSQLLTGLLMALPLAKKDSKINVKNLKSRPYIDMTIGLLKHFGIEISNNDYKVFTIEGNQKYIPGRYEVEGDWSGAAFLLVAGAIKGDLSVTGLSCKSKQSDKVILDALNKAGARINIKNDQVDVSSSDLKAFDFDATDCPDLFPPLVTLATYCKGTSHISGASRLIHKESNRADTLKKEFEKLNIKIDISDDVMSVTGGTPIGAKVESHEDHRIAMAMATVALGASGRIYLRDSQCVAKSYPDFYKDMKRLGAVIYE